MIDFLGKLGKLFKVKSFFFLGGNMFIKLRKIYYKDQPITVTLSEINRHNSLYEIIKFSYNNLIYLKVIIGYNV